MSGVAPSSPKVQFLSSTGDPLVNGLVSVFVAGSTTLTDTWQDVSLTTLNTNPIQLDARGEALIWLDKAVSYKFRLKDAAGATQWTVDDIQGAINSSDLAAVVASLAADSGSSRIGFFQVGVGAASRTAQDKLRERWSLEDHGAVGDGVTDDRANLQSVLNALSVRGGGVVYGVQGKTYLVKAKGGSTKSVGSVSRSYGLEIPDDVIIDLQGATIKAFAGVNYVLLSNVTTATGTNNNHNLGIINGIVNYDQASSAGTAMGVAFYGVRKLRLDQLEVKNGYNIAMDLEGCDQFDIGTLVFRACTGAAFYVGGATASGGAECTQGSIASVTCYDTVDHPTNPGLPGNPVLLNASYAQIGEFKAFNSDAGIKITNGHDVQIGRVLYQDGNTQNSGLKVQGANETQLVERWTFGEVICLDCGGTGLFLIWCRDVQIGSYIGKGNVTLGLDSDASLSGDRIKIGNFSSIDSGRIALEQSTSTGTNFNRSPSCTIDNALILNPWAVATSGSATGMTITNGTMKIGYLSMVDDRATPTMIRYFGNSSQGKEQSIVIDEFYGRAGANNPDFYLTGLENGWVGRPDVCPLNFAGGTLTLTAPSVGTGRTATASVAVFAATDVGKLIKAQNGRGVAEITAFTSTTVVTVAVVVAFTGTSIADDDWYLDRGNGGTGSFSCTGAATSTAVTDYSFINTTTRGFPLIEVQPTNASARTLKRPTAYTWAGNTVTFEHPAAAGGETYQYRILGWTS